MLFIYKSNVVAIQGNSINKLDFENSPPEPLIRYKKIIYVSVLVLRTKNTENE